MTNIFGPRHPHVGRVLNTNGTVCYRLGEFDTAIDNSERALQILEQFHGAYHPHIAEALEILGFMYRDKGNLIKSKAVLELSLQTKHSEIETFNHFPRSAEGEGLVCAIALTLFLKIIKSY